MRSNTRSGSSASSRRARTGGGRDPGVFPRDSPAPERNAARALVAAGVRLVGTDAPSVDPYDSAELETHRVLGAGGVAARRIVAVAETDQPRNTTRRTQ